MNDKQPLAKIQKNEDGTVTTTTYKPKATQYHDRNNNVYSRETNGVVTKIGQLIEVQDEKTGLYRTAMVPLLEKEPKNKKERMKARQGLAYYDKDGNLVLPDWIKEIREELLYGEVNGKKI